jgi:uncharacterized protein
VTGGRAGSGGDTSDVGSAGSGRRPGEPERRPAESERRPAESERRPAEPARRPADGIGESSAERGVEALDRVAVAAQLGRVPRAMRAVAHRCPCGLPDVVETSPRLAEGTPFPTLYYLTCPRASSAVGRLEASGVMREMADRLRSDSELASAYRAAHEAYLARRVELGDVPEIDGVSAGGMPIRVKCLHALLAHSLAAGPGVNPLGDEVRAAIGEWWAAGPCVSIEESE